MEKEKVVGVHRLFVIIFFFVVSIFFLNSQKKKNAIATHIDVSCASTQTTAILSPEQVYHQISSLLTSHNIDLIVKFINQSTHHCIVELIEKIILDNKFLLSNAEKMRIIFGAAHGCHGKKNLQYRLFDFLMQYNSLSQTDSPLLLLMRSNYVDSLPVFMSWLRDKQKDGEYTDKCGMFVDDALLTAIDENDYHVVERMLSKKIRVSPEKASYGLWSVVAHNKDSSFVSLLVRYAQADVNYIHDGKTLLIEAVEQNNKEMIQALLDEGAVVDRVVDPMQGTALQIAIARNDVTTAELLREYGA